MMHGQKNIKIYKCCVWSTFWKRCQESSGYDATKMAVKTSRLVRLLRRASGIVTKWKPGISFERGVVNVLGRVGAR